MYTRRSPNYSSHSPVSSLVSTASLTLKKLESAYLRSPCCSCSQLPQRPYENVPYVAMRMLPATLGIATVPLAYLTLRALDCRATTALLAYLFIIFDNAL